MKRMFLLMLSLGLVSASYAAIPVPTDKQNSQVVNPFWAGASVCDIGTSTGTTDILCASGKGVVFGILTTSGTSVMTEFVTLRDSATANHSSTVLALFNNGAALPVSLKFVNGLTVTPSATFGANEHISILYRLQSDQN